MGRDNDEEFDDEEAADEVEEMESGNRTLGGFVAGIAVGALLGAAAALLLAPASGHVTRRRLKRKLEEVRETAGDELGDFSRRAKRELKRRVQAVRDTTER